MENVEDENKVNPYLKNNWNRLDFIIVLISIANWVMGFIGLGANLTYLRALRALRALRPLRMVSRNEGLKAVVSSVFKAIPAILNTLIVSLLFYLIFGILGIILFKGKFYYCNDTSDEI